MTPAEKTRATIYAAAAIPVMALLNVPGFRNRTGEKEEHDGETL